MNSIIIIAAFGAALSCTAQELPKPEAVLDRYLEVTGGRAAYEKIHSEVVKGTIEFAGRGMKGTLVSYQAEPASDYTVIEIAGVGKIEDGFDGEVAWEKSAMAGPRVKSGEEREEMKRASVFNAHLNVQKIYEKFETAGSESVNGEDCWKLILTPKTGSPSTEFYSKKTGLLLKGTTLHSSQMGEIAAEAYFSDYKDVSGILVPFSRTNKLAGQEIQVHLDSIEFNAEVPKNRFKLPEDVKGLLRKNGGANDK